MKISAGLREKLARIVLLVFDVDGVLTQGEIFYTDTGVEAKAFDVKDGLGIRVASDAGLGLSLMSGRTSQGVQRRARDLRHGEHPLLAGSLDTEPLPVRRYQGYRSGLSHRGAPGSLR